MSKEKLKACKDCGTLTSETNCPNCKSNNLADKYKGTAIIFDKDSVVAQKLEISKEGKYALKY